MLAHDGAQELLVLAHLERRIVDYLAAPYGNEEEHVMRYGADALSEIGDVAYLVTVPIDHRGVDLERKPRLLAAFDARHRERMSTLQPAEPVVLGGVEAVDADAHGACARLLQAHGNLVSEERAVGAEHRSKPCPRGMLDQFEDIGPQQRLSSAEDHDFESGGGYLVDKGHAFFRGKFARTPLIRILIAMRAA